jgi:DNA-directed RNA polymerase specialized sigma24 family protein
MLGKEAQILPEQHPGIVQELYDKYSGMVFGYIYEVVKDIKLAEEYLTDFYTDIPKHLHEINTQGANTWCQLHRLAKRFLSQVFARKGTLQQLNSINTGNRFLGSMTEEQRQVFYNVYYNGSSTAELSYLLNRPEESIRKSLKEAFLILKQGT